MTKLTSAIAGAVLLVASVTPGVVSAVEINGGGATFPAPLYYSWIQAYEAANPDVTVNYEAVGSGAGIKGFIAGKYDFGASDAAMTDAQMAEVEGGVGLVPATSGAVVVAYNLPGFEGRLRLSRETLIGIFAGEITDWNDERIAADNPDADLPNRTIAIVTRRDSSGTTFAFTNHLAAVDEGWNGTGEPVGTLVHWPGRAMTANGNDGVAGRIRVSEYSVGYVEYGFAKRLGLPLAELQNRSGNFVAPDDETVAAALDAEAAQMPDHGRQFIPDPEGANAYPIVTYSWILVRRTPEDPEVGSAIADFVDWGLTDGQAHAPDLGYVPLPPSVVERAQAILRAGR